VMKLGDIVEVKVLEVSRDGKFRLTRRELLPFPEGEEGERAKERMAAARESGGRPGGDRGGRGGDRGGRGGDRGGRGGDRGGPPRRR